MRVALLTPAYWPEVMRGTERFVHDLAHGLLARGHGPRVITSHRGRSSEGAEDGLPVTRVWRPPRGSLERRLYERYLTHLPAGYLALRRGDDDIAHAMFQTDAVVAARWSEHTGRPSVFTFRAIPDHRAINERRMRLRFMAEATARCRAVVAPSGAAADALRRWMGAEARVISPGVDLEAFRPSGPRAEDPTILCATTPDEPRKRVPLLLEAFDCVRRQRPGARLQLVVPPGSDNAAGLRSAGPGVELLAPMESASELAAVYSQAWVTAQPSLGDGFPATLVESLACGTPVVGSLAGAVPEIVDTETVGRLFDGGVYELCRALLDALELATDPATPAACREHAMRFSLDRCADSYAELYAELLSR
jgi:phosphatidyl-myo-inositol alpha-mannosyltransferase